MKVYVVDNGGQWTHREYRVLKYLDVDAKIVPNRLKPIEMDCDALILSGGAPRIGTEAIKLGSSAEYLEELDIPILGICVGCQFIAIHFGGDAGPAKVPEFGKTEISIEEEDALFESLPPKFIAWESHNDEIKELGPDMIPLARSENCRYQTIRHKEKPIYGVQFHPEVEDTEHGSTIFKNFIELAGR